MDSRYTMNHIENRYYGKFMDKKIYNDMISFIWKVETESFKDLKNHYQHYYLDIRRYGHNNGWKVIHKRKKIMLKGKRGILLTKILLIRDDEYGNN